MFSNNTNSNSAVVLLAAGESSRMGTPKQLLRSATGTLIEDSFRTATAVTGAQTVVVLGANADVIRQATPSISEKVCINAEWKTGMGSSIKTGLKEVVKKYPLVQNVIFTTCDMPAVDEALLQRLIDLRQSSSGWIIAASYGGTAGIPALFFSILFNALLNIDNGRGAKQVIDQYRGNLVTVDFPGGLNDLDTPEQYRNWKG